MPGTSPRGLSHIATMKKTRALAILVALHALPCPAWAEGEVAVEPDPASTSEVPAEPALASEIPAEPTPASEPAPDPAAEPESTEMPALAVMPLAPRRFPADAAEILDDVLAGEIDRVGTYKVITTSDIRAMLGMEALRQATGCDDVSCAAEIGGALGAPFLLVGSVSRLGDEIIISIRLIDTRVPEVTSRAEKTLPDDEKLYAEAIREVVADLLDLSPTSRTPRPSAGDPFESFELRFRADDWKLYLAYRAKTPTPVAPLIWASDQNKESTALFVVELALTPVLWAIVIPTFVALEAAAPTVQEKDDIGAIGVGAVVGCLLPTIVLLIFDVLDIGSIEVF